MTIMRQIILIIFLTFSVIIQAKVDIGKECLGHYKYDLPESSHPSLLPIDVLVNSRMDADYARFPNGDKSFPHYDNKLIYNARWFILDASNKENNDYFLNQRIDRFEHRKNELLKSGDENKRESGKHSYIRDIDGATFFVTGGGYHAIFFAGKYGYYLRGDFLLDIKPNENDIIIAQNSVKLITPRKLNEIPPSGLCTPMAVLKETDEKNLNLTANYQLIDHPELTFSLEESVVTHEDYKPEANRSWIDTRLAIVGTRHSIDQKIHLLGFPRYRSRSLGGNPGMEVLSRYVGKRTNKPVYFYIARTIADKPGESSFTFMARLDESKAKGTPLTADEFEAIVTRIASSIERRN